MKKLIKAAIILFVAALVLTSCGSKNSEPSVEQIKKDLIGKELMTRKIASIEDLKVLDTINTKSTDGKLKININIEFTTGTGNSVNEPATVYYVWTDNAGWKYEIIIQ